MTRNACLVGIAVLLLAGCLEPLDSTGISTSDAANNAVSDAGGDVSSDGGRDAQIEPDAAGDASTVCACTGDLECVDNVCQCPGTRVLCGSADTCVEPAECDDVLDGVDDNGDGVDGLLNAQVYASVDGDDRNDGLTPQTPVRTLQKARDVAQAQARATILMTSGTFVGTEFREANSGQLRAIAGGYDADFVSSQGRSTWQSPGSIPVATFASLPAIVDIKNVEMLAPTTGGVAAAVITVYVRRSPVRMDNVVIHLGTGSDGQAGAMGANGLHGGNGNGMVAGAADCVAGGDNRGGNGGAGGQCVSPIKLSESGERAPGNGGLGGSGGANDCTGNGAGDGNDGGPGANGALGSRGTRRDVALQVTANGVVPTKNNDGGDGLSGLGGGGGGGGGASAQVSNEVQFGGSGGGGGAGGCGGGKGRAGESGGFAVGIFVLEGSSILGEATFVGGTGGDGGDGGGGGCGGEGGIGGAGGLTAMSQGGPGGKGGVGGAGGGGAGGNGGSVVGLYLHGISTSALAAKFEGTQNKGLGGDGGDHPQCPDEVGEKGADGNVELVKQVNSL